MTKEYYKAKGISELASKYCEVEKKYEEFLLKVVDREFSTAQGNEYAKQGFLRRCKMLWRCIEKTFEIIPPDLEMKPSIDETSDATIFLHCFIIHIFGACDDLAWLLVHEKSIFKPDGGILPNAQVGFRKNNKNVRKALSENMIGTLDGLEKWFDHIDAFRHSLAHRIPLYVPPYMIPNDLEDEYTRLERESWDALRQGDLDSHKLLKQEQNNLTFFRPWFTHSFAEKSPNVVIHPQILVDFDTVIELGEATLKEL